MALPKLNTQTFELEIPSTDEKIKYRPFLVKEEKILLQAQEGEDIEMIDALMTIISNCTFGKVDPKEYPSFDMEYIFLKIRSKAVGEKVSLTLTCPDDNITKVTTTVDISKVEVSVEDGHSNKIELTDDVSCVMKYPTVKTFAGRDLKKLSPVDTINMTGQCIHQIIDGKEVYEGKDLSEAELAEFLENLTQKQFSKIQTFFTTMPRLKHVVNVTNPKTKKKGKVTLEGMQSFF
jgi:hypothetical protein